MTSLSKNVFNVKSDLNLSQDKSKGIKQFTYTIIGKEKISEHEGDYYITNFRGEIDDYIKIGIFLDLK